MNSQPATAKPLTGLFAADLISTAGTEMTAVALPWFVLTTTGSPVQMSTVLAAEFAGLTLLGLLGGRVATVLGARRMMLVSDVVRAGLVGLIPVLHWLGGLSLPVLIVVGFAVGGFFPAYSSAQRLVLAGIVGDSELRLTRVGGLMGSINELGSFIGPALGGVLVALIGPERVLLIDSASYLTAFVLVLVLVPMVGADREDPTDSSIRAGLRYLLNHRALRRVVLGIAVAEIGWTALVATLPLIAQRTPGGAAVAGWLLAAYGAGSVIGGLASSRARTTGGSTAIGAFIAAAGFSWLLLAPVPWWATALAVAGNGVCAGVFFPRFFAAVTTMTPPALRARVMTSVTIVISAPGPVGFLGAGLLAQATGSPTASLLLVGLTATVGAVVLAGSGWIAASPVDETEPAPQPA